MGKWQTEVGRMMLYVSFPVGIFHYFNHGENIEGWLTEQKKKYYPANIAKEKEEFTEYIDKLNRQKQLNQLRRMEEQYRETKAKQMIEA
ncbi:protein PET100 homolog, mitochondrial-like [Calliopsis andreniformis]|uniref:protein PET100 homolog, mitochondrial-like n=1 Tax=Calliopsis andreniformis TaxID=337506 RepID=UPI003FCC4756